MSNQEFADFEIDLDLTNVKPMAGGDFPLLPIGTYKFAIKNVEQKAASTGNNMIVTTSEVVEVIEVPGIETEEDQAALIGQKVFTNYVLLPQSMGRIKQLAMAVGAQLTGFRAAEYLEAVYIADVIHNAGKADVGPDGQPRPGKTFANISNERSADGDAPAEPVAPPPVTRAKNGKPETKPAGAGRRA